MTNPTNEATNQTESDSRQMTVDEARKVMWLRNNLRSMGDLLDEGYLDQRRLEWAATKAYDSKIKQAAQVLLHWQHRSQSPLTIENKVNQPEHVVSSFLSTMTIEQARAIRWPFHPYRNQPMGILLDEKLISLKDLGYAIENARDNRVREAAITLTLVRLNQKVKEPVESAGFLHVVSAGRSYAERKQLLLFLYTGLLIGGVSGALLVAILIWQRVPLVFVVTIIVLVYIVLNAIITKLIKRIKNYREGQEGEERVVAIINQVLDGNWFLFRDVVLPGRNADLDAVLVGPTGVWALEIKSFSGEYRNIGEHWEYRAGNRWKLSRSSPSRQCQRNAIHLSNFLRADGIQQWINGVVVWANPDSPIIVENPSTSIWLLNRLPDELGNIWQGQPISEHGRQQIVEKLTKLCQKQEEPS